MGAIPLTGFPDSQNRSEDALLQRRRIEFTIFNSGIDKISRDDKCITCKCVDFFIGFGLASRGRANNPARSCLLSARFLIRGQGRR